MYYLVAQSTSTGQLKILDCSEKKDDVTSMVAAYLKQTRGQLVETVYDMQSVGCHIIQLSEYEYEIYKTENVGWVKNNFYSEKILTYKVVLYNEPSVRVSIPRVDNLKCTLKPQPPDFTNNEIFF